MSDSLAMADLLAGVTRLEVIDEKGRAYTQWDCALEPSIQDQGRTLKLFVSATKRHAVATQSGKPPAAVATNRSSSLLPGIDTDVQERLIAEMRKLLNQLVLTASARGYQMDRDTRVPDEDRVNDGDVERIEQQIVDRLQSLVVPARTGEAGRKTKEGRDGES